LLKRIAITGPESTGKSRLCQQLADYYKDLWVPCDPWILGQIKKNDYHLYLLCDIDLPWEPDPQREHPDLREYFFEKYRKELKSHKFNYKIVSGLGKERLDNAIKLIDNSL